MTTPLPTLADVFLARRAIAPHLRPTPVVESAVLGEVLGCRAVLKCENLNPTGAFKVRGGVNLIASLEEEERARGVVAASTGNHAQSVAFAARIFRAPATIFMPEVANPRKVAATRALGAEVVQVGRDFDEARAACEEHAGREGVRYVHSIEPLLVTGVATAALELLEAMPELEVLLVPMGGGSGAIGAGVVARAVNPAIRVIAVQAEGAPAVYRSWKERRRVTTDAVATFAEGLATREPFDLTLEWLPHFVDEVLTVNDDELAESIRCIFQTTHQVAEGAGAAAVAAAAKRRGELAGKRVGLMLSGGNLAPEPLRRILGGGSG